MKVFRTYLLLGFACAFLFLSCSTDSKPVYQLTTNSEPVEGGNVSQSAQQADQGETLTITANPNEHWVFNRWSGDHSGSQNPASVVMDSDKSVTAMFEKREYPLAITIEGEGIVREEIIQAKSIDFPHGTIVQLNAEAVEEWEFKEWTGDIVSDENPLELTIDGPVELTAVFVNIIEERIENVKEKATLLLPSDLLNIFTSIIEEEVTDIQDQIYLESLNEAYAALIDSVSKYSNVDDFKDLVAGIQSNIAEKTGSRNLTASSLSCTLNPGLGFSRSAETYAEVSAGFTYIIGAQVSARGGGGTEFIYDFVNMDRGVYTYTFCGLGAGLSLGGGGSVGSSIGIGGLRKFLFNIKPNQRSVIDRFEGANRSHAAALGASVAAFIDLDLNANIGFGLEVETNRSQFIANHLNECPGYYFNRPVHGGIKEVFLGSSLSGGISYGAEILGVLKLETLGSYKTFVNDEESYSNYGVTSLNKFTRLTAAGWMAAELAVPEPKEFIVTGSAPLAAALALVYSLFDPSGCASPMLTPDIETLDTIGITTNGALLRGNVLDDGGQSVTKRGICWSETPNPTTNNNCTSDGTGTGTFTSELSDLFPETTYYVRAFATNSVGTAYGNQKTFKTASGRDSTTIVLDVTNPQTGRTWMDRNLGASREAISSTDTEAYGDLFQWGRMSDGHQKRNSANTFVGLSSSDQPGHGGFIPAPYGNRDWRDPQNNNLWQGLGGINNPCPDGYRIPTTAEWEEEIKSWSSNNASGAFSSHLKLPLAGGRYYFDGSIQYSGRIGYYWSSTVAGTRARALAFQSGQSIMVNCHRSFGFNVRCIKN